MTDDYLRPATSISDISMLRAIQTVSELKQTRALSESVMVDDLAYLFAIHRNRIRSKMRRMNHRSLIRGCCCGCRGEMDILPAGKELLSNERVPYAKPLKKYTFFDQ